MEKRRDTGEGTAPAGAALWAYGYQMIPPRAEHRMKTIRALLDEENSNAKRNARNWTARLVTEQQVTHLLIVSDNPEMDREISRKLEARLRALEVKFSVTLPMPVGDRVNPGEK